jgi:lipopolysaccharide export system permease protein
MGRTRRYILETFAKNYLLVFLPFLLIVSLVFVIQLSILSSRVNIGFEELFQLFGYMLPEIFFYTIPFSLIAALANSFSRFSDENELIALFSLGFKPREILLMFLPILLLFSAILLTLSILLYPQMKQKINYFKQKKIAEATLNIAPNKLSQNFGSFHVFVDEKNKDNSYKNMVLFNKDKKGEYQLFIANKGVVTNNGKNFTLTLNQGLGETSDLAKIQTVKYKQLKFYQYHKEQYANFMTSKEYWSKAKNDWKRLRKLLYLIFVSISPLLIFGLVASLTFYNPRYQRGFSSAAIFIVALTVYLPAAVLQKYATLPLFTSFALTLLVLSFILIWRRVLKRF